jgi:integrase
MARKAKSLDALTVSRLKVPGLHAVGGIDGLYLQVSASGSRSWILRYSIAGKRRDMGLGSFPEVSLAEAREQAQKARSKVREGTDPILERKRLKSALIAEYASSTTFAEAARSYIAAHESAWKNSKHAAQWTNTLETYAYPVIGDVWVKDVTVAHIMKILEPIWTTKNETAMRLRGRIESVLDAAKVRGQREGENPARWKGHLENLLANISRKARTKHHPALPYEQIPVFMSELRAMEGVSARALEFLIFTVARSGEVRGAAPKELNMNKAEWVIPAERMKAKKEHHVPLSSHAVALVEKQTTDKEGTYLFPGRNGMLSDMSLTAVLRRMGYKDLTVHGFRSTFRDWAAERTNYPREVCEHALAHQLKDKAEAAYQRGTLFEKRRNLMNDWAKYCDSPAVKGEVIPINKGNNAA